MSKPHVPLLLRHPASRLGLPSHRPFSEVYPRFPMALMNSHPSGNRQSRGKSRPGRGNHARAGACGASTAVSAAVSAALDPSTGHWPIPQAHRPRQCSHGIPYPGVSGMPNATLSVRREGSDDGYRYGWNAQFEKAGMSRWVAAAPPDVPQAAIARTVCNVRYHIDNLPIQTHVNTDIDIDIDIKRQHQHRHRQGRLQLRPQGRLQPHPLLCPTLPLPLPVPLPLRRPRHRGGDHFRTTCRRVFT